ncbi:MAG: phage tail protein [Frankiaceae bacterium]
MTEPFIGEIRLFGFNFAPRGWATCSGQILSIAQNTALFSLLGTMYGGNGQTTFALPDLRGRVAISFGQGPGLSNYTQGEVSGSENVTLIPQQMPQHNHTVNATSADASANKPGGAFPSAGGAYNTAPDGTTMAAQMIGMAGGSQPHENRQPYLVLNYCIALEGIFPSRN